MSELKSCPFCGGALHIWKQQITPKIGKVAECDKCCVLISIPWALEEFQAVEFLSRRAAVVNCAAAEHDSCGCLGYSSMNDDEPIDRCKWCEKYTGNRRAE